MKAISLLLCLTACGLDQNAISLTDKSDGGTDTDNVDTGWPQDPAIYVALSGSDANDGTTPQTAVASIQLGVDLAAACAPDPCDVKVAGGTHQGPLVLADGVSVQGGFNPGFDVQDTVAWPTTITTHGATTVVADAIVTTTQFRDFTVIGGDFSDVAQGTAVFTIWVRDSTELVLADLRIEGGSAGPGVPGEPGATEVCYAPGGQGGQAYDCGASTGGSGSAGGDVVSGGFGGAAGGSNCPGVCPLVGHDGISDGGSGTPGDGGSDGAHGEAANDNDGRFEMGMWVGTPSEDGTRGAHGTGGGGGGAGGSKSFTACFGCGTLVGGRGADGTNGGCAGSPGTAGTPGGGSFGLTLLDSTVTVDNVTVITGRGGDGGDGGDGGAGGPPGTDVWIGHQGNPSQVCGLITYYGGGGGVGGVGGWGGAGGSGAGGMGGPAVGIAIVGDSNLNEATPVTVEEGISGRGGVGGLAAESGLEGISADIWEW